MVPFWIRHSSRPLRNLFHAAWQAPIWAALFAVFFGTLRGGTPEAFVSVYGIALTFSSVILFGIWGMRSYGLPLLQHAIPRWKPPATTLSALYVFTSLSGSLVAAVIVHLYVQPGFLGSIQRVVVWAMFSIIFVGLMTSISLARRYHGASVEQARMQNELDVVREIQESFMPGMLPEMGIQLDAVNLPSRTVSGDFFDIVSTDSGLLLAIADVEGKSVPAAVLMATIQASLRTQAQFDIPVASIVRNINVLLCRRGGLQRFASLVLARLDPDGSGLTYCNAGHNPPLLQRHDGTRLLMHDGGMLLGVMESAEFNEGRVELRPGDRLVLYTDGVVEAVDREGEEFQLERLSSLMGSLSGSFSSSDTMSAIVRAVDDFAGGQEPADDRTILLLTVPEHTRTPDVRHIEQTPPPLPDRVIRRSFA